MRSRLWLPLGLGLVGLGIASAVMLKRWAPTSLESCRAESEPEACLEDLAGRLSDASLCQGLKRHNDCLIAVAIHSVDGKVCQQIADAEARAKCVVDVVELGGDATLCPLAAPEPTWYCFARAAAVHGPEVCQAVAADERGSCLVAVASELEDLAAACGGSSKCLVALGAVDLVACDIIPTSDAQAQFSCLAAVEHRQGWVPDSVCSGLTEPALRDRCLARLAETPARRSTCALVKDAKLRERCIHDAALVDPYDFPDSSICQGLEGPRQQRCVDHTAARLAKELARTQ